MPARSNYLLYAVYLILKFILMLLKGRTNSHSFVGPFVCSSKAISPQPRDFIAPMYFYRFEGASWISVCAKFHETSHLYCLLKVLQCILVFLSMENHFTGKGCLMFQYFRVLKLNTFHLLQDY